VKRLSVSVLVDQGIRWEKQQQVLVPPTPEKMKMIHDLVAGVIGFNATRGDQLTVETLPFESTLNAEPPSSGPPPKAPASGPVSPLDKFGLPRNVLYGIGAGVLLLLVTIVVLISRRKKPAPPATAPPAIPEGGEPGALPAGATADQVAQNAQRQLTGGKPDVNSIVSQVRDATRKDADTYAEVLQTWLTEEKAH
jgi:flagellar M-ring protein FliF